MMNRDKCLCLSSTNYPYLERHVGDSVWVRSNPPGVAKKKE
jgi:hypothetical protein